MEMTLQLIAVITYLQLSLKYSAPTIDFSVTADPGPTLQNVRFEGQKKRLYIPYEIGSKYREFGTFLLEDHNGAKVQEIESECHSDPYWINYEIFRRWLHGEGSQPVTWATLVRVLRDIGKSTLVDDIEAKLANSATPSGIVDATCHSVLPVIQYTVSSHSSSPQGHTLYCRWRHTEFW